MRQLVIATATMGHPRAQECMDSWLSSAWGVNCFDLYLKVRTNAPPEKNLGVLGSIQWLYQETKEPIISFFHDDVIISERNWDLRVLKEFENPKVGLVGFGGATAHGTGDLYTSSYRLQNLARMGFASNLVDAEAHGERFTGSREVVVLDGFFMAARREMLDKFFWPTEEIFFHCYDYFMCCMARRLGYKIRMVGIACQHLGGATSVGMGVERQGDHERSHRYIWEEFRDVLPARV